MGKFRISKKRNGELIVLLANNEKDSKVVAKLLLQNTGVSEVELHPLQNDKWAVEITLLSEKE